MGKKSKIGKQRKDKFYHLAKETGFRSRAAFKLLQLNRKFEFLQKARVLVDLCAAPGGWMQVAKQNMPVSSIVIGIDLYPIKPVPGCLCLTHDITTPECQSALAKELQSYKADVFLNDGAPNVGQNWLYDAYSQSCLTLSALKLCCYNLREGGWFITKVFRSKDYNALMWVFKQLFKKVHATKPQASRSESAEIFVVCQHYLKPAKLDLRFFNANYVFKDLEVKPQVKLDSESKSKKPKAEGYPDNITLLFKQLPVSTYMSCKNPAIALQDAYEIVFDDPSVENHPNTTKEIKECCKDIKVLGRKDIRVLMNWWKVFQEKEMESKPEELGSGDENKENDIELSEDEKELDEVDKQIKELQDEEKRDLKRKKKKTNKERTKLQTKMNLKMVHKNDLGPTEQRESGVFHLSDIKTKKALDSVVDQEPDIVESEDSDAEIKPKKAKYDPSATYLDKSGMFYRSEESESEQESSDDVDSDTEGLGFRDKNLSSKALPKKKVTFADPNENHPLITDLDYRDVKDKRLSKAELWFDKDIFKNVENEEDEDYELDKMAAVLKSKGGKMYRDNLDDDDDDVVENKAKPKAVAKKTSKKAANEDDDETTDSDSESDLSEDEDPSAAMPLNEWDDKPAITLAGKKRKKRQAKVLDDKGLALGTMIASSKKMKRDIIDGAWNRYAFNDDDLPDWFVQDEAKHMRKDMPVPKELVDEFGKRHEEINIRPIKKVGEAKARKKKRALRKMEKAKKKLEGVVDNVDVTEAEKARQVRQIYKKLKQPKAEIKYVVSKKHTAAKRARRPPGVKGPYKVVDPRMKKDMRAKMRMDKKKSNKKGARAKPLVKTRRGKK